MEKDTSKYYISYNLNTVSFNMKTNNEMKLDGNQIIIKWNNNKK